MSSEHSTSSTCNSIPASADRHTIDGVRTHSGPSERDASAEFRRLVGYDVLKSTLFVPLVADGAVRFEGRGWGHGVGLSQFGARGMAERGHPYAQILAHYYPGASLVTLR